MAIYLMMAAQKWIVPEETVFPWTEIVALTRQMFL